MKTIQEMAREAGWDAHHAEFDLRIEAFAALVREDEREACAKVVTEKLRRLHEVNQTLLDALKGCLEKGKRWHTCDLVVIAARAAIEKAGEA